MSQLLTNGLIVGSRYEIRHLIGEGGMQQVFLAHDLLFKRSVALKAPKNVSAQKRFRRSAIVSAKVNHSSVAKTLDYLEEGDNYYLIEEFVEGKDLQRVRQEDLPYIDPHQCAMVFHHLARGLAASHHVDVVHRDLKPSNIMVVGASRFSGLKITDFGIAKMAEAEIAEGLEDESSFNASATAMGALPYMAPEAIESLQTAGKPADVWALAAIIFEQLCGEKPFGSGFKAAARIFSGNMQAVPSHVTNKVQFQALSKELIALLTSCLVRDPQQRPTADQLVEKCSSLFYLGGIYEPGVVTKLLYGGSCGFIDPIEGGADVFFHQKSFYGKGALKAGTRVMFKRHKGDGADRAFPVVEAAPPQ